MAALVIAEHDNASLKASTLNTVTAAVQCSNEVHILIAVTTVLRLLRPLRRLQE